MASEQTGWDHRYRRLSEGETILPTDECQNDDGSWKVTRPEVAGSKAPNPDYTSHRTYRRLIPATPPPASADALEEVETLQSRVHPWLLACFGAEIAGDTLERTDRFIEEALELAQTNPAFTAGRAHALVNYVFGRPVGEPSQEVGGVMITLAALCLASGLDMHEAGEIELARIWTKVDAIRAKQAAKPTGSALPIAIEGLARHD